LTLVYLLVKLKDKIFSPLGKLISNITPTPSILSSTLPRSSWHHLSPASTAILASSHAPSIVLVQHMIAGISTEPWHLAMVARVVEVAVGWKGEGRGGEGGGCVAPGPGEGEGDHGQHVLVLQVVKHGKPDVLFLGRPSLDLTSQPSPSAPTHSSPLPLTPSSHPCPSHFRASPHLLTSWYLK